MTPQDALQDEATLLGRFYRLQITIGLSATRFGYITLGSPTVISRLKKGHKLHEKNRRRLQAALDEIEKGHSEPLPAKFTATRESVLTTGTQQGQIPAIVNRSPLED